MSRKDRTSCAIPAEIDPIAKAPIDLVFENARADAFGVREISLLHFRRCLRVEAGEPFLGNNAARSWSKVTYVLPFFKTRGVALTA